MSESESRRKFADLNMTKDELNRFTEAMKKEEFRKLLVEYAEELSDPKNREQYEKEISQLEEERGMNVTFIHPEKGFCIKTTQNGDLKCFINICKNPNIDKPTSRSDSKSQNGKVTTGLYWEIPHTCSPAREDLDHEKVKCVVYDVVFNPDSYRMGETNERFKNLLKSSAMDTIETNYHVKLDRVNAKVLKNLPFKGRPNACVIKKKMENFEPKGEDDTIKPLLEQIKKHELDKKLDQKLQNAKKEVPKFAADMNNNTVTESEAFTAPKYSIIHRGLPEMSDHANQLETGRINVDSTRPKEIVISIELPLLKSSQNVALDVFETTLELSHNEPNYKLNLKLPYPVRETEAKAKFDKSKRCLNVTLPVIPYVAKIDPQPYIFPLSAESSKSNSSSSISDNSINQSVLNSNKPPLVQEIIPQETKQVLKEEPSKPIVNKPKYNLPTKTNMSETRSYISFKFSVNNYVKDSIKVRIISDSILSLTLESCSLSGCYIQYYSIYVELSSSRLHLDLVNDSIRTVNDFAQFQSVSFDFSSDSFVLKLKKSELESSGPTTASISIDETKANTQSINIEQDMTSESIEQAQINDAKVNNMSRKDYVMKFKDIINDKQAASQLNELDEDDDLEEQDNNEIKEDKKTAANNSPKHEKLKFEERKLAKLNTKLQEKKIDEQPELERLCRENSSEHDTDHDDYEKDYLQSQLDCQNNEENDADDDSEQKQNYNNDRSSSCSYDSSLLGSSLNSNSSFSQLKGILKKPRSFSESESSHSSIKNSNALKSQINDLGDSLESTGEFTHQSEDNLNGSKKSVHFNNQVVRNMFKSNSTVQGMKKPNSNKNRKKNQRKRTISDPSHDSSDINTPLRDKPSLLRNRSISESTDDDGCSLTSQSANSLESINEEKSNTVNETKQQNQKSSKNKKKNKKKSKGNTGGDNTSNKNEHSSQQSGESNDEKKEVKEGKNAFDMQTMLDWKQQGLLPDDNQFSHSTECSFKFKNKIINDLDD